MTNRFTGLSQLAPGIETHIGAILVANEIGSTNAYRLAHADIGAVVPTKSGYSFGGNQVDLAGNEMARALLKDILEHTQTQGGQYYQRIAPKLLEKGNPTALTHEEQAVINTALGTPYGHQKLDALFVQEVRDKLREVRTIITSLPEGAIKHTLQTVESLVLYLVDYHNQFHIDARVIGNRSNGKMYCFLAGQPVEMYGGTLQLAGHITTQDIINFGLHTQYHQKNPKDLPRRYKNIEAIYKRYT